MTLIELGVLDTIWFFFVWVFSVKDFLMRQIESQGQILIFQGNFSVIEGISNLIFAFLKFSFT